MGLLPVLARAATLAATVPLAWDAGPDPTTVGYNLYYGVTSGHYTVKIPAGTNTSITVAGLTGETPTIWQITAY